MFCSVWPRILLVVIRMRLPSDHLAVALLHSCDSSLVVLSCLLPSSTCSTCLSLVKIAGATAIDYHCGRTCRAKHRSTQQKLTHSLIEKIDNNATMFV